MKIVQWLFGIISLSFSLSCFASYLDNSLTIEGLPNSAPINVNFEQAITEYIDAPNPLINAYCGLSHTNGFFCGFVNGAASHFQLNLTELANGDVELTVVLAGTYDAFNINITGFNSPDSIFTSIDLTSEINSGAYFVDPGTTLPLSPLLLATEFYIDGPVLAGILQYSNTADTVEFSLPEGTYHNMFQLTITASEVPLPAAFGLYFAGILGLFCLRKRA